MRSHKFLSTAISSLQPPATLKNPAVVASIAIGVATLARLVLDPLLKNHGPYMFFAIAVVIAALYAGKLAGITAIILSIPACDYLFIEPRYTWFIHDAPADSIMLALFGVLGILTTFIIERFHDNRARLKQSLLDLKRSESEFEMIDANVPEAIFTANDAGIAEHLNLFFSKYSGCELGSLIGSGWLQLIHPDDRDSFLAELSRRQLGKDQFESTIRLRRFDGGYRAFKCHATRKQSPANDKPIWFGVCSDIQNEKVLSAALEKRTHELIGLNESLERYAYTASHDLQEPLRTIATMTELFLSRKGGELDAESSQMLALVVKGADRMKRLIRDIMDLAKTANAAIAAISEVDMRTVVESAIANLEETIRQSGARVIIGDLPVIYTNESAMLRVFQNLIANAIKYRGDRRPEIHITGAVSDREHVFAVRDNGIGIDPQYREEIFEPFRRLHDRSRYDGSGLGLATCRRIIRALNGKIWVDSAPNEGSTFFFAIPKRHASDQSVAPKSSAADAVQHTFGMKVS